MWHPNIDTRHPDMCAWLLIAMGSISQATTRKAVKQSKSGGAAASFGPDALEHVSYAYDVTIVVATANDNPKLVLRPGKLREAGAALHDLLPIPGDI